MEYDVNDPAYEYEECIKTVNASYPGVDETQI